MLSQLIRSKGQKSDGVKMEIGTPLFFHLLPKFRGSRNRIDRISVGGSSVEDEEEIKTQASIFFSTLLQSSSMIPDESLFNMATPSVSTEQNQ